jgi:DNA-binding beta-propeller fold protein YncE
MENSAPVTFQSTFGEMLVRPYGITLDDQGNLYVTEAWGGKVSKFDENGNLLLRVGRGEGGMFKKGCLNQPAGIALDKNMNMYLTDLRLGHIKIPLLLILAFQNVEL